MHKITHISMETDVLAENRHLAEHNLQKLRGSGVRSVDIMGTTGAGKTALIIKLAQIIMGRGLRVAAIAGDVTGQDDYDRFEAAGVKAFNLNTGKECHLDAHLLDHALDDMDLIGVGFPLRGERRQSGLPGRLPTGHRPAHGRHLGHRGG